MFYHGTVTRGSSNKQFIHLFSRVKYNIRLLLVQEPLHIQVGNVRNCPVLSVFNFMTCLENQWLTLTLPLLVQQGVQPGVGACGGRGVFRFYTKGSSKKRVNYIYKKHEYSNKNRFLIIHFAGVYENILDGNFYRMKSKVTYLLIMDNSYWNMIA